MLRGRPFNIQGGYRVILEKKFFFYFLWKQLIVVDFQWEKTNYSLSGPYLHVQKRRKNKMIARKN